MNEKSIDTLRAEFDAAEKGGFNTTPHVEAIALRYILEEYNYRYNRMNTNAYIRDFLDRNVSAAEEYCIQALADNNLIDLPERHFNYPNIDGAKQGKLRNLFAAAKSRVQPLEDLDTLSLHYLEMDDDPKKIVYNQEDLFRYLQDWLRGVHFAEKHIKRVSRENLDFFLDVVENGSKKFLSRGKEFSDHDKKRIYHLVTEFLPAGDVMARKLEILSLKQAILQAKKPQELASILLIVLTKNYTVDILGDGTTTNEYSTKLIETSAFCYLDDKELFIGFCDHFKYTNQKLIAAKIYSFALEALGHFPKGQERLNDFVEKRKASISQTLNVKPRTVLDTDPAPLVKVSWVANQEEIAIPFYAASLRKDVQMLLDVGYRNGKEFHELLMTEFRLLSEATYGSPLDARTNFYQELMAQPDMRRLKTFDTLKKALTEAYNAKGLKIPAFPVVNYVQLETKKDGQKSANFVYDQTKEPDGVASRLLGWMGSSKPSDDDVDNNKTLKPDL